MRGRQARRRIAAVSLQALFRALLVPMVMALIALAGAPVRAQEGVVFFEQPGDVFPIRLSPSMTMSVRVNAEFADLVVGDAEIADALPLTSRSLYIQAKKFGRTNIAIYDRGKNLVGVLDLTIGLDLDDIRAAILDAVPNASIRVLPASDGIRLSGTVPDGVALQTVLDVASEFTDKVINTIRVKDAQQVLLEVRFVEASRSAGRELGVSWGGGGNGTAFAIGKQPTLKKGEFKQPILEFPAMLAGAAPFGSLIANVISAGINVDIMIRALEAKHLVRRLAEPNLTATSGQTASFLAGGEVPLITPGDGDNPPTVTLKEFGIRLSFTPVVLDKGLISITLRPEVSDVNPEFTVQGNPSFIVRRTETTVELYDGQSFAIAGLLSTTNRKAQEQLPWIGQLPILGALFRSSSFQKEQTDLVVIITAHLVRPSRPGEPLRTPLDKTVSANDPEFFLLGLMEVPKEKMAGFATGAGISGPYGHIIDLPKESAYAVK